MKMFLVITLDGKKRELNPEDLLICNEKEAMCIAGVFGGEESGVKNNTTTLFLESAWFEPRTIRKTSFRHQLRTDAASRFEKGVDISNTVNVLKRAATLIVELAGGKLKGEDLTEEQELIYLSTSTRIGCIYEAHERLDEDTKSFREYSQKLNINNEQESIFVVFFLLDGKVYDSFLIKTHLNEEHIQHAINMEEYPEKTILLVKRLTRLWEGSTNIIKIIDNTQTFK
jgi:hypothetical protein